MYLLFIVKRIKKYIYYDNMTADNDINLILQLNIIQNNIFKELFNEPE